ncbi:hypothetical protein KP509_05G058400 [Ceratopteris richardii]|uniref:Uncharacterized protein n=1 Tax=Ceratopteris richardii TaxID=49495 RepID=A0A8T2UTP5_CERRI|nr:hypothetical protein KP509_05G058400 [Ceratopteris richardii]
MVGGMTKRDDGLPAISSTNIFSALESRRRKSSKKRSDKEKGESKSREAHQETTVPQVWTPAPVTVTNWADCEEDDDDYFALPALPPIVDQPIQPVFDAGNDDLSQDTDGDEEVDDGYDENEEEEPENDVVPEVVEAKATNTVAPVPREPDRQLSKKELKKKELAELDAVLAELGLNPKDEKDSAEVKEEQLKDEHTNGDVECQPGEQGNGPVLSESKSSKRRKSKKEKPVKEERDEEGTQEIECITKEESAIDEGDSNTGPPADKKEVLKKLASMKKKKSFKEGDGAAKAAAAEAALRAAKLAAAKKKEKNHYNQQPVR